MSEFSPRCSSSSSSHSSGGSDASFGRPLREEQFAHHARNVLRLNNGSFGACPADVLKAQRAIQDEWNSNPDDFWHSLGRRFEETRAAVARRLLRARSEDVFVVDNLTTAAAALAHSLVATISEPDSVVLLASHTYHAVQLAVRHCCALAESKNGISIDIAVVDIPFPVLGEDADEAILSSYRRALEAIPPHKIIRLAFVDHLTSLPAMKLPLDLLVPLLRAHGTLEVVVDAAHSPGLVDIPPFLEGPAAPDYYMANLHKWCMAPVSAAFLWVAPTAPSRGRLHHPILSHCCGQGFDQECAMLGTRDYSAMLAVPAALDFIDSRLGGLQRLREHNAALCYGAAEMLAAAWGTADLLPARGLRAGTAMVGCPAVLGDTYEEGETLRLALRAWKPSASGPIEGTGKLDIPQPHAARGGIVIQRLTPVSGDRLYMRISAAPYNYMGEFEVLRDAVLDIAGQGRSS